MTIPDPAKAVERLEERTPAAILRLKIERAIEDHHHTETRGRGRGAGRPSVTYHMGAKEAADAILRMFSAELARLTKLVAEREWLPISEAPRDGTRLLLWSPREEDPDDRMFIGYVQVGKRYGDTYWRNIVGNEMEPPIAFMPLPPAPLPSDPIL